MTKQKIGHYDASADIFGVEHLTHDGQWYC